MTAPTPTPDSPAEAMCVCGHVWDDHRYVGGGCVKCGCTDSPPPPEPLDAVGRRFGMRQTDCGTVPVALCGFPTHPTCHAPCAREKGHDGGHVGPFYQPNTEGDSHE